MRVRTASTMTTSRPCWLMGFGDLPVRSLTGRTTLPTTVRPAPATIERILRQPLARVEEPRRYCSCERTSQVHLLPEAHDRPASSGPVGFLRPLGRYDADDGGATARRSRMRTASMRFSRTD